MRTARVLSDQSYDWSEENNEKAFKLCTSQASKDPSASATSSRRHSSRLTHRALQALRQARLQVCRRARPRPKALPFGNTVSRSPSNGLRAPGLRRAGGRVSDTLPLGAEDSRRDLRDQSGTTAPKGRYVGKQCGRSNLYFDRSERSRNPGGQHAPVATGGRSRSRRGGD